MTRLWFLVTFFVVAALTLPAWAQQTPNECQLDNRSVAGCLGRAKAGDALAQYVLAAMYETGEGVPQNDAEAVRWHRLAAAQGFAEAQYRLGVALATGLGVRENDIEAVRWYRLAAAQGLAMAHSALGLMYAKGAGVPQNDARGYMWVNLATAALSGDERAAFAKMRDSLAARLSPEQRAAMQKLAATCQASGFKDCGEPVN